MKTQKQIKPQLTSMTVMRLTSSDTLIGINEHGRYGKEYHIQAGAEIIVYNQDEMMMEYGIAPESMNYLG